LLKIAANIIDFTELLLRKAPSTKFRKYKILWAGNYVIKMESCYFQSVPVPVYRQVAVIIFLARILYTMQLSQGKNYVSW